MPSLLSMHASEIAEVLSRSPFRPFVIIMSDSTQLPVSSLGMIGGNPRAVHWFEQAEPYRVVPLDPAQITQIVEQ